MPKKYIIKNLSRSLIFKILEKVSYYFIFKSVKKITKFNGKQITICKNSAPKILHKKNIHFLLYGHIIQKLNELDDKVNYQQIGKNYNQNIDK